jgi:hypothetical protein
MPTAPRPFSSLSRNAMRPGATPRNPAQLNSRFDETNPIFSAEPDPGGQPFAAIERAIGSAMENLAPKLRAACDVAQPAATPRNAAQPNPQVCKTNPIAPGELDDPRRLAAARLLAQGRSVPDAARELNLSRGTVWRWQRDPAFRAELRRIHERMMVSSVVRSDHGAQAPLVNDDLCAR